jgi:hypothetical protein
MLFIAVNAIQVATHRYLNLCDHGQIHAAPVILESGGSLMCLSGIPIEPVVPVVPVVPVKPVSPVVPVRIAAAIVLFYLKFVDDLLEYRIL